MKNTMILLPMCWVLGACVYAESPAGRFAAIDLPVHSQTTIHKTVTVNAPAGTIVNISEPQAATVIYRNAPRHSRHWQNEKCHDKRDKMCW